MIKAIGAMRNWMKRATLLVIIETGFFGYKIRHDFMDDPITVDGSSDGLNEA